VEGLDVSYEDGPLPERGFQGPGYRMSFGDPDQAVRALMPNDPQWARSAVRQSLEDTTNIRNSRDILGMA
jgi:hypothetical protein